MPNIDFDTANLFTGRSSRVDPSATLSSRGIGTQVMCDAGPDEYILHNTAIGIEIELEGNPYSSSVPMPRSWMVEGDGSLRNEGREFILRKPLRGSNLSRAINKMCAYLQTAGYETSERCSTHIHVDVTDLSPVQIRNFLCLTAMLEPLLFRLFGNTREVNTFCLPTNMGTTNFGFIVELFSNPERLTELEWSKYAGIGLCRIGDLGTVEFRMFEPITNADKYFKAINLLGRLKDEAAHMNDPKSLVDFKLSSGISRLFSRFFPEMQYREDYEELLEEGIQTLNDIINSAETVLLVEESVKQFDTTIQQAQAQRTVASRGI